MWNDGLGTGILLGAQNPKKAKNFGIPPMSGAIGALHWEKIIAIFAQRLLGDKWKDASRKELPDLKILEMPEECCIDGLCSDGTEGSTKTKKIRRELENKYWATCFS